MVSVVPCPVLKYNVPGTTYTCIRLREDPLAVTGTFSNVLKFKVKDCDQSGEPDEEGYDDEYVVSVKAFSRCCGTVTGVKIVKNVYIKKKCSCMFSVTRQSELPQQKNFAENSKSSAVYLQS